LTPSTRIFSGSPRSSFSRWASVSWPMGTSIGRPAPEKMRPYHPSML
jgi:hypothetical protein